MENTKIGAYATSHLNSDNEGEPRKIYLSFSLFISFNYWLLKGKVCTSQVSVMFNISDTLWEWLESIKVPADESYRDGLTKKAAHLNVENTKIGAYATSHLKSDNEGEPGKNISFVFFVYFFQLLIIEREGLYLSSFCNVSNISGTLWEWLESIKFQLMSRKEMAWLKKQRTWAWKIRK